MTTYDDLLPTAPVDANGHYAARQRSDGRWMCVEPMTFRRARLALSHSPGPTAIEALDAGFGYCEIWEYPTREAAIAALEFLEAGPPTGWTRHHRPGRPTERA